jgi:hypothetical protein
MAHANVAHFLAVFFTKQRHGAGFTAASGVINRVITSAFSRIRAFTSAS